MNKQTCFTHSMEQYSAIKRSEILTQVSTWLNLENVVLSERSQIQHATSWMIPFLGSVPKRQIHGDRKQITSDQGLGWRKWRMTAYSGWGSPFWWWKCSKIGSGVGCTSLWVYQSYWPVYFKWENCMTYLNARVLSRVWLFATPWTVAPQAPVCGIFQARILEWVAISFSRESSQPRDRTCISCTGRRILYHSATHLKGICKTYLGLPWWSSG